MVILFIQEILAPNVADAVIKKPSRSEPGESHDTGLVFHGNMPSIEEVPRRLVGMETQGGCHTPHSEVSEGHDTGLILHGNMPLIEEIPRRLMGMKNQGAFHIASAERERQRQRYVFRFCRCIVVQFTDLVLELGYTEVPLISS